MFTKFTGFKTLVEANHPAFGTVHVMAAIIVDGFINDSNDEDPSVDHYPISIPAGIYEYVERTDHHVVLHKDDIYYFVSGDSWDDTNVQEVIDANVLESVALIESLEAPEDTNEDVYDGVLDELINKLETDGMGNESDKYYDKVENSESSIKWLEEQLNDDLVAKLEEDAKNRTRNTSGKDFYKILDRLAADVLYDKFKEYFKGQLNVSENAVMYDVDSSVVKTSDDTVKNTYRYWVDFCANNGLFLIDGQEYMLEHKDRNVAYLVPKVYVYSFDYTRASTTKEMFDIIKSDNVYKKVELPFKDERGYTIGVTPEKVSESVVSKKAAMRKISTTSIDEGIVDFFKGKTAKVRDIITKFSGKHMVSIDGEQHEFVIPKDAIPVISGERKNTLKIPLSNGMLILRNNGFWRIALAGGLMAGSFAGQSVQLDKDMVDMLHNLGAMLGGTVHSPDAKTTGLPTI